MITTRTSRTHFRPYLRYGLSVGVVSIDGLIKSSPYKVSNRFLHDFSKTVPTQKNTLLYRLKANGLFKASTYNIIEKFGTRNFATDTDEIVKTTDNNVRSETVNESKLNLIHHLKDRGLVASLTSEKLIEEVSQRQFSLYCGADPTAKSLHLGNLLPLMILLHFYIRGHNIIGIVGGATGSVGDPSGRTTERTQMDTDVKDQNAIKIRSQMEEFFNNGMNYAVSRGFQVAKENADTNGKYKGSAVTKNNYEWWKNITMLDFLANYGKYFRVNTMIARDSVSARLNSQAGIGYHEFSYQLIQSYDYWYLYKNFGVSIQVGGNDQWGNIVAGIDLITGLTTKKDDINNNKKKDVRKLEPYGLTVPLLTTASGEKFGKSAGNAVFLNSEITKPYDLFQYFMKVSDDDVEKMLKMFTLLPLPKIEQIITEHQKDMALRTAQRVLAKEVTDLVHGVGAGDRAELITSILFPSPDQAFPIASADVITDSFEKEGILKKIKREDIIGQRFTNVLALLNNASKKESRRLVTSGGIYVGFDRKQIIDESDSVVVSADHLIDNKLFLLRIGKGKYIVASVEP